jgi:cell shape-determining protein MreD
VKIVLGIFLGIFFAVFQTACLPNVCLSCRSFDMLLPLVIYLSVFRPVAESLSLVAFFGIIMDCLSGSPFGLYVITYVWLLLGVRGSMYFLDAGSYFLFPLIMMLGMVFEYFLFAFTTSRNPSTAIFASALLAIIAAPFFLMLFNALFGKIERIASGLGLDRQG